MGQGVVKLGEGYLVWSRVVDAPVTYLTSRERLVPLMLADGTWPTVEAAARSIDRADRTGTSFVAPAYTVADLLDGNRAGPDETELTEAELVRAYLAT